MKSLLVLLALASCLAFARASELSTPPRVDDAVKLIEVKKIWDKAPHNAFTDLVRFNDRWLCVFREGQGHVSANGALRVIESADGQRWQSAALLQSATSDLRDAKITVTPSGELMLCGAEAVPVEGEETKTIQSLAWFSKDGHNWSEAKKIGDVNFWLWRVTWHRGTAYGIGYGCGKEQGMTRLYASKDGRSFETLVERLFDTGYPNETSIVFSGDTAYCLLRRDKGPEKKSPVSALIGVSKPPYKEWEWKDLGVQIGGPHMIQLPDGRWVAAVRLMDKRVRTSLCWLDPKAGTLKEFLTLPSAMDTSYAGLILHDGLLWVSYYSSHGGGDKVFNPTMGHTSIYLAKVQIPPKP